MTAKTVVSFQLYSSASKASLNQNGGASIKEDFLFCRYILLDEPRLGQYWSQIVG